LKEVSMNTLKSLSIAIAMAFALLLGMAAPAMAQGNTTELFERAHERCQTSINFACAGESNKPEPLGEFADSTGTSFEQILEANQWDAQGVSPDTLIPPGFSFATNTLVFAGVQE